MQHLQAASSIINDMKRMNRHLIGGLCYDVMGDPFSTPTVGAKVTLDAFCDLPNNEQSYGLDQRGLQLWRNIILLNAFIFLFALSGQFKS